MFLVGEEEALPYFDYSRIVNGCRLVFLFHRPVSVQPSTSIIINSPYAERPKGSRNLGLLSAQTFGTVRNIS